MIGHSSSSSDTAHARNSIQYTGQLEKSKLHRRLYDCIFPPQAASAHVLLDPSLVIYSTQLMHTPMSPAATTPPRPTFDLPAPPLAPELAPDGEATALGEPDCDGLLEPEAEALGLLVLGLASSHVVNGHELVVTCRVE
jgi:hypothetical protein